MSSLAYRDTTAENRNFWRAELSQALQEIQQEYDSKVEDIKTELESVYTLRMQEVRTNNTRGNLENTHIKEENKRLKALLNELRDRVPLLEAKVSKFEFLGWKLVERNRSIQNIIKKIETNFMKYL